MDKKKSGNFEKLWKDTRKYLTKFSKDAQVLIKKGEKEIVKLSGQAKINFEIIALKLKREQLLHIVGKEYVKLLKRGKSTNAKLYSLVKEIRNLEKQITANKRLLNKKK